MTINFNCVECGGPHKNNETCPTVTELRKRLAEPKQREVIDASDSEAIYLQMIGRIKRDGSFDVVNKPLHYNAHPSGIECIQITEHMNFCLGNAVKYLWRAGLKSDDAVQDLEKAVWYIQREIKRLQKQRGESK